MLFASYFKEVSSGLRLEGQRGRGRRSCAAKRFEKGRYLGAGCHRVPAPAGHPAPGPGHEERPVGGPRGIACLTVRHMVELSLLARKR